MRRKIKKLIKLKILIKDGDLIFWDPKKDFAILKEKINKFLKSFLKLVLTIKVYLKLFVDKNELEKAGMIATGINTENNLVEIVEIPSHPWFLGVQFHPEYKSTVVNPHPLFCGLIEVCSKNKK